MNKPSRRHHYLPQFYLRGFADERDLLWVFDGDERAYRHQGTLNLAVEKDFYTIITPDGKKSDEVERMLANHVEGPTKAIIERLNRREPKWEGEEYAIFALFVALMRTRNPAFDKEHNESIEEFYRSWAKAQNPTPEVVQDGFSEYEAASGESMADVSALAVFEMFRDDQYEVENPRQNNIKAMLELALELAPVLTTLNWLVRWSPKSTSFITSDNPFVVMPPPNFKGGPEDYGILTPGATTILPLTRSTCIYFRGKGGQIHYGVARKDFVGDVNCLVAANSDRFIIARDKAQLESVVRKTKGGRMATRAKTQVQCPGPLFTCSAGARRERMNNSQKACLFCGHIMHPSRSKGRGKSEEHIIPQWLMDHLGIRDMPITSLRHDVPSGTITNKRWHPVGNFVAGKVCADCNNGWMSDLEVQAKPILIRLIADPHQLSYLPEHERHTVARWTLKTAGVLNRASTSGNSTDPFARPVHDEHLRKVQSGSIPGDVIVVGSGCPSNTISDALQNASWAVPNNCVPLLPSDRERSYKIGLSFRSLLLAVAYYPNPEYHYGITEGSYAVLWDGTERIIRTNDGVGEVPILADSPILEGFLGNIFVVSKTWWTIRENTVATRFVVVPQR